MSTQLIPAEEPPNLAQMRAMNEALVLGSVRQHELTEAAENLNARLREQIAERERAEAALRASARLFASLVELAPFGMYVVDARFQVQQVNSRALPVFASVQPLLGRDFGDVIRILWGAALGGEIAAIFRQTLETGEHYRSPSFTAHRPDLGVEQSYEWEVQRVTLPNREHAVVCYFTDISERRALEDALAAHAAELARVDRSKDEFLAMLAHELRNPLAPLPMVVTLLRETTDPVEIGESCDIIARQVAQLVHLVDDLLDVARINAGKIDLRREFCDLADPLRAAFDSSRPAIDAAGHRLEVTWPETPVEVDGDRVRLTQIFVNLLNNAAKYSNPRGSISVDVRREGADAVVRVQDSGFGIAPDVLPHVFELFTQSHQGGRARGGLGIGLNLVQRMAEMHGGSVTVTSELGVGSEFTVRLPLAAVQGATAAPAAAAAVASVSRTRRILVVDDNVDAARILGAMLQGEGHEVRVVHEGWAALAAAPGFAPDTALLDLGLPDLSGLEVARSLRQTHPDALLIAITGWGQEEDCRRSREAGCAHHLVKPVDPATLRALLAM